MENADWAAIVNIEQKRETGQYYLTFKRVKIRYKPDTDLSYFNHPFLAENRVKLIDDVGYPESLSEMSLSSDFDGAELVTKKGKRSASEREVISEDSNVAENVFDFRLAKLKHQILPTPKDEAS